MSWKAFKEVQRMVSESTTTMTTLSREAQLSPKFSWDQRGGNIEMRK